MTEDPADAGLASDQPALDATVLPQRYVVVVDQSGPGPALKWALHWAGVRSLPIQLAGPPGTLVFSREYLAAIATQVFHARKAHATLDISAAPGGTCDLRPDDLLIFGVRSTPDDITRSRAARQSGLAPRSTLIVPPTGHAGEGIVAAISSTDRGRPVARVAAAEAELRGAPLVLLHVGENEVHAEPQAELAQLVASEYPTVVCTARNVGGSIVEQILAAARDASLIVVGSETMTTPDATFELLARMTPTPILVARPEFAPDSAIG